MARYIAKVKSCKLTPSGGAEITIKGVKSAAITVDHGMLKEFDADDEVPFFYKGQVSKTVELELRDYDVAVQLASVGCVSSITLELANPVPACSTSAAAAQITLAATNLAVTSGVSFNADASGTPTTYSITLELGHNDSGAAGTWTITAAGGGA